MSGMGSGVKASARLARRPGIVADMPRALTTN
jgi:hypothetical protein